MSAFPLQFDAAATIDEKEVVGATALEKWIDERPILQDINFQISSGEFVSLLGANGAGKSTLLKILATLTPPTSGELRLFTSPVARDGAAARSQIGLISHQSLLYRDLSARQNLEFYARLYRVKNPRECATKLLERIGLLERADDPVKSFSRGMTQRVAIARALVHEPKLLLADEPFDGLDAPSIASLEQLLGELHKSGKTIIVANHNLEQSLRLTHRAIVLREGQVVIDRPSKQVSAQAVLAALEPA